MLEPFHKLVQNIVVVGAGPSVHDRLHDCALAGEQFQDILVDRALGHEVPDRNAIGGALLIDVACGLPTPVRAKSGNTRR